MESIVDELSRCHEAGVPRGREDFGISSGTNAARTDLIESTPKNAAIVEVVGG